MLSTLSAVQFPLVPPNPGQVGGGVRLNDDYSVTEELQWGRVWVRRSLHWWRRPPATLRIPRLLMPRLKMRRAHCKRAPLTRCLRVSQGAFSRQLKCPDLDDTSGRRSFGGIVKPWYCHKATSTSIRRPSAISHDSPLPRPEWLAQIIRQSTITGDPDPAIKAGLFPTPD